MVTKCRIPRADVNSSPTVEELTDFAYDQVIPYLLNLSDSEKYYRNGVIRPQLVRQAVADFIRTGLGESYDRADHKYFDQIFDIIKKDEIVGWLAQFIPNIPIKRVLQLKGTAEEVSSKIFTDQIEDDDSTEYDSVNYFLNNAYGTAILAKAQLERKMTNIVLNSFVIDRAKGQVIGDIDTALEKVEQYKRNLFAEIQEYFALEGNTAISSADIQNTPLEELITTHQREISKKLQVGMFTGSQLQDLYEQANNPKESSEKTLAKATLNAYGAWLALRHFDNFIQMAVGETIVINPSSPTRYSYSSKGTNINTTWRKDDNIDLQAEINKLTQALISTSPMLQFGTTVVSENAYLQFSDFSYITAKIKDLVYNPESSTIFISQDKLRYIWDALSEDEQDLVRHKSLRQIISNSRYNPQKYIPLIYKILTSFDGNTPFINRFGKSFNNQDKNLLWTIYKNIYDSNFNGMNTNHSLYSIQQQNLDSRNYYAAVSSVADCIFSVDFAQYVFDNGVLKLRTLRDAAVDKTRKEIENIINTKNSNELAGNFDFSSYNMVEHREEGQNLTGVSFQLMLDSNTPLYVHVQNMGETITISESPNIHGEVLSSEKLKNLITDRNIQKFFDEVLGLNLSSNAAFRRAYQEMTKQDNDDITQYVTDVLNLSSHVFFNRYFAQKYLNRATRAAKVEVIKEFFTDEHSRPRFNDNFFNMDMIPSNKYNTILNLAQALGSTRGINSSRQVKDSDNAMLSSQTLSRLLGNMIQQLDIQINAYNKINSLKKELIASEEDLRILIADYIALGKSLAEIEELNDIKTLKYQINQLKSDINTLRTTTHTLDTDLNPAASQFSLITNPNLFKGMLKSEEIKGVFSNKKQVKFTTSEAVISSFLHNFVLGFCDKSTLDKNSEFGSGVVGLLPSVNSDKTTVSIAKFDLNTTDPLTGKAYKDLLNGEIIEVIRKEIGTFYQTMYDNIKSDYAKLSELIGVNINPDDNFAAFRAYIDTYNKTRSVDQAPKTMVGEIFKITTDYNNKNPHSPIRIIDQIHYIADKKGNITFNNTIKDLKNRFANPEATAEFFKMKSAEVLKSALDSEFTINLFGNSNLDSQPEINYLRNEKNYTQGGEKWSNDSGQMIIAKYTFNNAVYDITNKADLLVLEKRLTLDRMAAMGLDPAKYNENPAYYKKLCGFDNLSTKIHLLKDGLKLHPMLEKYNLMDYLFTQQIMSSTVGSHVAHPAKGSFSKLISEKQLIKDGVFKSSSELTTEVSFVSNLDTTRTTPVAARWNGTLGVIEVNLEEIRKKYEEKAWTKPALLSDQSRAAALDENTFTSYDEWLTFILEHETAHRYNKRHQGESIGHYETRINQIALKALNYKKQQALLAEEASRFYAQHKRNVSFTAAMDQFQLNQIDGIPLWYNIAIIDDIKEDLFTIDGQTNDAKPFDGATFVNPIIMYLENNSLNEARAGIDKKQFVHFYDELTGSGGIIKTAGFALTNDRMRNSVFYRDMMKNMTNRKWQTYDGQPYVADITKDFRKKSVNYGNFYFKKGTKYYKASITKNAAPNTYDRTVVEVDIYGNEQGVPTTLPYVASTNYELWEMFGGMHSQSFNGGKLQPSEASLQLVTKAVVNTGELKPSAYDSQGNIKTDITAEHIDQPLKNADIHYMPTIGAVKQGAANMNPKANYYGSHDLNFFKIRMTNAGIQLDKEHHADGSTLSLMTQVISSACSMGYNPEQAAKLYNALYNLTMQGIREFKEGFKEILNPPKGVLNPEAKFETAIADCMIKNMMTSTAQDGDMLRAIASDLIKLAREGKELSLANVKTIPYSDPSVFNKLVTNLSVMMTKAGIKAKMNGVLSVLCPTNNIVKMYDFVDDKGVRHNLTLSQLEEMYGDDYNNIIAEIQANQPNMLEQPFEMTQIEIGKKYLVKLADGTTVVYDVKFPHTFEGSKSNRKLNVFDKINKTTSKETVFTQTIGYQTLKNLYNNNQLVAIQEFVVDGKELGSINYKFKDTKGRSYQVWDINYIQDLFETMTIVKDLKSDQEKYDVYAQLISKYDGSTEKLESAIKQHFTSYANGGNVDIAHKLKLAKLYAKQLQQDILFALSTNNPTKLNQVRIGDELVTIDKQSITIQPYELVMPKIFLKEFGLDDYANLDEIVQNPNYFYDRMVNNFHTKVFDETLYDLELKKVNGQHIYLKNKSGITDDWYQDVEQVIIHKKTDELGRIWRIDPSTNKKMYQLFDNSDEVYRVVGTDIEIILTSDQIGKNKKDKKIINSGLTFYLNNFKYQSLHISEAIAAGTRNKFDLHLRPQITNILDAISYSSNKNAKAWLRFFRSEEENKRWIDNAAEINTSLNNFDSINEGLKTFLQEQSINVHTSLLKSLDIIAARIPAQNQQSFMPMKVVAWDNPNINTAYVSVMQFFLQGSDLDIDAVSLLTHSFSDSGEFQAWSPDFNMSNIDLLNQSLQIPFPTGRNLTIIAYDKQEPYVNVADRLPSILDNEDYKALTSEIALDPNVELQHYISLLKYIETQNGVITVDQASDLENEALQKLIQRIDEHNTYLNGVSDDISSGAIKNYVVSSLYSISSDAANLLEAHTGVDVATGPIKNIANESELSEVQKTFTPGNVFNKFQAIEEASVGKDDIAICATGLKAFFAATQFCNSYLNSNFQKETLSEEEIREKTSIINFTPVQIGGRTFNSLANIRVDDLSKLDKFADTEIYRTLKDKGFDDDASVIMSALLSLSTDNAKELCLAKINAGTSMIGMYLYGAAIGMDFEVMNKIIASPLGFTIAKLLNSNEFNLKQGKTSVDAALSYLFDGPTINDLNKFNGILRNEKNQILSKSIHDKFIEEVKNVFKHPNYIGIITNILGKEEAIDKITIKNFGRTLSTIVRHVDYQNPNFNGADLMRNLLHLVNTRVNNYISDLANVADSQNKYQSYKALSNQLHDFFTEYVGQVNTLKYTKYTTAYGESDIKDDLNKLALGADEFKRLGQFLRLNQEIKTKPDELISFVLKIENVIVDRAKLIKRVKKRLGESYDPDPKIETFDFKEFAESFISNPNDPNAYHNKLIELYEQNCKTCVNPLRILTTVPHYRGYLESMILAYEGDYLKSTKFRAIKHIGNTFIKNYKVQNSTEKTQVYKGVQTFVDDYINNAYLSEQPEFILPKTTKDRTVYIYDVTGEPIQTTSAKASIKLGTEGGNITFEHFFEDVFLPALQNSAEFGDNEFVKNLTSVLVTDSVTGIRYLAKSLSINMMPSSDNERILFNQYKNAFSKLDGQVLKIGTNEYSIIRMFQYYNLLKFKGRSGRSSLSSIFEDIMAKNEDLKNYRMFVSNFDSTYDFVIGTDPTQESKSKKILIGISPDVLFKYIAPTTSPFTSTAEIIKYKNRNTGQTVLLERKPKTQDQTEPLEGDLGDYGYGFEDDGEDGFSSFMDEMYQENMGINLDIDNPDYGDYQPFGGNGVLTRFNPTSVHTSQTPEQVLDTYTTDGITITNIRILDGNLKQFTYNSKVITLPKAIKVVKIVKQQGKPEQYILDENIVKSIIQTEINCG